jgi:hypothetical protein
MRPFQRANTNTGTVGLNKNIVLSVSPPTKVAALLFEW